MKIGVRKPEDCPARTRAECEGEHGSYRSCTVLMGRGGGVTAGEGPCSCNDELKFPAHCPLVTNGPILIEIEA